MYYSTIKEQFRGNKFTDKDYAVLFDIGDEKVMIFDDDTNLLYDLYKNKLESPQEKVTFDSFDEEFKILLVAKKDYYKKAYNLNGVYYLDSYFLRKTKGRNGYATNVTNLNVIDQETSDERQIFPSRFKVYSLHARYSDEFIGGTCME